MERSPDIQRSPELALAEKFGLTAGKWVTFKKIAMHSPSEVPVGDVQEGTLNDAVRVGSSISFTDSAGIISRVQKMEEKDGQLLLHTKTSTYLLESEKMTESKEDFEWGDIDTVETGKGSTYRYLPDGTTQRFKKMEDREYHPQAALVYVPPIEWAKQRATPELLERIGKEEQVYEQNLLTYVQNPFKDGRKVYIVDATGKKLETNEEIKNTKGQVYLAFLKNGTTDFCIPVSHKPVVGFYTFDTRAYDYKETGEHMRESHLGNKVVKVVLKKDVREK